ncbi:MAG: YfhO family protein, partial [Oscillospiraceae bacterium]|nr:YfhO family protein [Oscillospiraceae bacterium]
IPAVQRAVNGAVFAFLALSLNCNFLDFMWHGFHFPNQLPGRWSFLFSLFVVLLICTAFVNYRGLSLPRTIGGIAIGFTAVYTGIRGVGEVEGAQVRKVYLILMAVSAAILLAMAVLEMLRSHAAKDAESKLARIPYNAVSIFCAAALAMVCIVDSGMSYIKVSQFENGGTRVNDGAAFTDNIVKQSTYGNEWASGEDEFYRAEANSGYTFNPSMIGGYHGMGYYSSTMRGNTFKLLRSMGNRVYADKVSSVYNATSPVQNGLFGIKYFIDYAREMDKLPATEIIETDEVCDIVENQTALSVAYGASDAVLSYVVSDQIRAVENQNKFLNAIAGEEVNVFRKLNTTIFNYENATLTESADWNTNYFHMLDGSLPVKFHYVYTCDADGSIYLEHNFRAGTITVTWDGGTRNVDHGSQKFAYLGNFTAGTEITIDVEVTGVQLGCTGMNLYCFDEARWISTYEKLANVQLDVTEFKANRLKGSIVMPQSQLVMTTIPQDGGWKAYCDGKEMEIKLAADELICVIVPEGAHTLEFKYHVPLLGAGIAISVTALLLCIWFSIPELRKFVFAKLSALKKA